MQSSHFISRHLLWVTLLLVAFFLHTASVLHAELDDAEAEERVRKLPASALDAKLPKEPFGAWLPRVAGPQAKIFLEVNDCGEQTGDPSVDEGRDFPACVQVSAFLPDGREFGVLVAVGAWEKGFVGKPTVRQVYWAEGQQTHDLERLSDIPEEIKNGPADPADGEEAPATSPATQ